MNDSQSALRELQKFLGNFKALLPILENAASIETQVKAGEAHLTSLKMWIAEAQGKIREADAQVAERIESGLKRINAATLDAERIKREADAYAEKVKSEGEKHSVRLLTEANANVKERETLVTNLKADAAKLKTEITALTEKRDALRAEMDKLKRQLA